MAASDHRSDHAEPPQNRLAIAEHMTVDQIFSTRMGTGNNTHRTGQAQHNDHGCAYHQDGPRHPTNLVCHFSEYVARGVPSLRRPVLPMSERLVMPLGR